MPSGLALVLSSVTAEPASGSVMPRLITMRPGEQVGQPALSSAAGVPYSAKVRIGPKLPNCTTSALRGQTARDLLDGDHRVHQRAAQAAVGLRDGDAHQPLLAHQLGDVERKARIVRALERVLRQMRQRERRTDVGEQLLLFGEVEVHALTLASAPVRTRIRPSVAFTPDVP